MRIMSPNRIPAKYALFLLLAPLVIIGCNSALHAQTPGQQQGFDYTPAEGELPALKPIKPTMETILDGEVIVIKHPRLGIILRSRNRWKSWVERALYLTLLNIALAAILASLPKNDEYTLIISYFVSGISLVLGFWIFLCAVLLFMMKSPAGLYVLPVALVLEAVTYILLMRIKRADVSLAELKDCFKSRTGGAGTDERLSSVEGAPGDWLEDDFLR
ncbi:MAG: hypothetical protein COT18_09985 [Elusimicrobia bacterium CG08_land_8_20_14_0_20_59_10]|nr:MAG: hypothetical protein COT18_09985 [Elusimicrobia bacterium CG08_land_8_20_14_0_20_59_10]